MADWWFPAAKNMSIFVWIVLAVVALWLIGMFNGLVRSRNRVKEAWSDIDVQLKRRYDLIPSLVETAKGYAAHEKDVFERVIRARAAAMGAQSVEDRAKNENMLSGALKNLFAVAEAYPDLKASVNFVKLQDEIADTENKVQAARRFYNSNVLELNNKVQMFPTNILANALGFKKEEFFQLGSEAERENVQVKF